jgi:hypothetical protein
LLVFTVLAQIILLLLAESADTRIEWVDLFRSVGAIGIIGTAIYKSLTWIIMALSGNKTPLDRWWLWNQAWIIALFVYAAVINLVPRIGEAHYVLLSVLWYEIFTQIFISAGAVLYYVYVERFSPILRLCTADGWCGWAQFYRMLRGEG